MADSDQRRTPGPRRAGPGSRHARGVMELIASAGLDPAGKEAVIVGRSNLVGQAALLAPAGRECNGYRLPHRTRDLGRSAARRRS